MPPQKWEQTLRRQIRDNHGNGWNVISQSGKCKLTRRYEDGTKSAKVLPIEWKATSDVFKVFVQPIDLQIEVGNVVCDLL